MSPQRPGVCSSQRPKADVVSSVGGQPTLGRVERPATQMDPIGAKLQRLGRGRCMEVPQAHEGGVGGLSEGGEPFPAWAVTDVPGGPGGFEDAEWRLRAPVRAPDAYLSGPVARRQLLAARVVRDRLDLGGVDAEESCP